MTDLTAERVRYSQSMMLGFIAACFSLVFVVQAAIVSEPVLEVLAILLSVELLLLSLATIVVARGAVYRGYCRAIVEIVREYSNPPFKELAEAEQEGEVK